MAGLLTDAQLLRRFIDELHRNPHGPQLYQQRIIEYLAGEQRLGRLPAVDLEAATTLFTGGTLMLAMTSLMGVETGHDLFQQLPGIVDTLWDGLKPRS
ncbi:MAG: hypothetical protein JWL58_1452 [Streptosporangiaceae bacterium]|nr:hypothetical protein [Streptosporangiaceae bacterium]